MYRRPRARNMFLLIGALFVAAADAQTQIFSGGPGKVTTVELFTSEGCSSCPPADAWLSRLQGDPRLWKSLIPMAFHVDYWDYIGWRDRFARPAHTERQREYQRLGRIRTVYTPGFVVDGEEWRGWFRGRKLPVAGSEERVLTVRVEGDRVSAELSPGEQENLELNLALLGFALSSEIARGENAGTTLNHDFVVLDTVTGASGNGRWSVDFPALQAGSEGKLALAAWVSRRGDIAPIQAAGGWLK